MTRCLNDLERVKIRDGDRGNLRIATVFKTPTQLKSSQDLSWVLILKKGDSMAKHA